MTGEASTDRFLAARRSLVEADDLTPARRRRALTDLADSWLAGLLPESAGRRQVALVAIGGYGRRELLPGSDLDVLLLYEGGDASDVADAVFYPVWDAGLPLDHAVRTPEQVRTVAGEDLRTMLGLLDARHVAGNAALTDALRSDVLADWRRSARRRLPDLSALCRDRAARVGELAHLLEPDLVEAYGGLRDVQVIRAVAASWVTDGPHDVAVQEARQWLLTVRDALHRTAGYRSSGRRLDRLYLAHQEPVAERLGLADADVLLRRISEAGRAIGYAADVTWRRADREVRARATRTDNRALIRTRTLADGVVEHDGEAVLSQFARSDRDAVLPLRAAAAAAQSGLPLAPHTVRRLAAECPPLPEPWPGEARHQLVSLLGAGRATVSVWEALDASGQITRWFPEWKLVRFRPQRSPIHRHTVDRHLVETVVEAATLTRRVSRPDLLLLAALFHDLGKGCLGDHSEAGAQLVSHLGRRIDLPEGDVATLETLVRHHLLLPEAATRRDPDDPVTIRSVAEIVGDADTLDLLAALTEADATAAGPAAWTPWRAALVRDLVARVRESVCGLPQTGALPLADWQVDLAERGEFGVVVENGSSDGTARVTVTAVDRPGLLATVAGVLTLHGLEVRGAAAHTFGQTALQVWRVVGRHGHRADAGRLDDEIRRAMSGRLDLAQRLASSSARSGHRRPAVPPPPLLRILPAASTTATVLEARASDQPGLLHGITSAVAATGVTVRSAVAETLGLEAVDVLYLVDRNGLPLDESVAGAVLAAVRSALEISS